MRLPKYYEVFVWFGTSTKEFIGTIYAYDVQDAIRTFKARHAEYKDRKLFACTRGD